MASAGTIFVELVIYLVVEREGVDVDLLVVLLGVVGLHGN